MHSCVKQIHITTFVYVDKDDEHMDNGMKQESKNLDMEINVYREKMVFAVSSFFTNRTKEI